MYKARYETAESTSPAAGNMHEIYRKLTSGEYREKYRQ